eukprot:4284641-Prymnesium_polylepis.1
MLALVLSNSRFREIQKEGGLILKTALTEVATSLKMLEWAIAVGCPYPSARTDVLCQAAAKQGDIELLRFAVAHKCPWERDRHQTAQFHASRPWEPTTHHGHSTIRSAALSGHVELIMVARSLGAPW